MNDRPSNRVSAPRFRLVTLLIAARRFDEAFAALPARFRLTPRQSKELRTAVSLALSDRMSPDGAGQALLFRLDPKESTALALVAGLGGSRNGGLVATRAIAAILDWASRRKSPAKFIEQAVELASSGEVETRLAAGWAELGHAMPPLPPISKHAGPDRIAHHVERIRQLLATARKPPASAPPRWSAIAFDRALTRLSALFAGVRLGSSNDYHDRWRHLRTALEGRTLRRLAKAFPTRWGEFVGTTLSESSALSDLVRLQSAKPRRPIVLDGLDSPIIICGFSHSGTRLLVRLLRAAGVFQIIDTGAEESLYIKSLNDVIAPRWMDLEFDGDPAAGADPSVIAPSNLAAALQARGFAGGVWGHKDPRNMVTAGAWLAAFPRARFVHLYRDPRDGLGTLPAVYRRHSPGGRHPQSEPQLWADHWLRHLAAVRTTIGQASRSCEVTFEALCRQPREAMGFVCEALGIAPPPAAGLDGVQIDGSRIGAHRRWLRSGNLSEEAVAIFERAAETASRQPLPRLRYG